MPDPSNIPLGLYIHLPWCARKCPYCDFNSHELRDSLPEQEYLNALLADLEFSLPDLKDREVSTVFIGGGTPSLFSPQAISTLLATIKRRLALAVQTEITLEANPGTVEAERFRGYHDAGINRLSLGIQSFSDRQLHKLGRIHDAQEAVNAAAMAVSTFDNVNLDLMYGLPEQTLTEATVDIDTALQMGATHLSCYELTLEPNTVFYKQRPTLPDEETLNAIEAHLEQRLSESGYDHYEVSAHAQSGHLCQHNINYWSFGDYLGIGAGAHSKLTHVNSEGEFTVERLARVRVPQSYTKSAGTPHAIAERKVPTSADLLFEFMLNALRLRQGFSLDLLTRRTGLAADTAKAGLQQARERGLINDSGNFITPTESGKRYLNDIIRLFLT